MKTQILSSIAIILALTTPSKAQERRPDLPYGKAERIEATRNAQLQRSREASLTAQHKARDVGQAETRNARDRDLAFMAVWAALDPEVKGKANARELAERISRQPEWKNQTRSQRIATVSAFITEYPTIRETRQQLTMDTALEESDADFPEKPNVFVLASSVKPLELTLFPETEVPDAFTINRRFNWANPHGQWMNQILKDIDAAKQAGDTKAYETLTKRYTTWAEQYLRKDR